MKQAAVVFEAQSAGSVQMGRGINKRLREGKLEGIRRREMKGACERALGQGGCVSSVCGVVRLIFHVVVWPGLCDSYSWPQFPPRESLLPGAPERVPC